MVRKAALIALMFATPLAAENIYEQSDTWTEFWRSDSGTMYLLETSKMDNTTNTMPSIWLKGDHSKDKSVPYRATFFLIEINCNSMQLRIVQNAKTFPNGHSTSENWTYPWESAVPDSLYDQMLKRVCPQKEPPEWLQSPVVG